MRSTKQVYFVCHAREIIITKKQPAHAVSLASLFRIDLRII